MLVKCRNVRLAFAHGLFNAKGFTQEDGSTGEPAFSCSGLMEPDSENIALIEEAMLAAAEEKWPKKGAAMVEKFRKLDKLCLHDGDTKDEYEGFEGMMFISARSKVRPRVVDRDRSPLVQADGKPYSGCYGTLIVDVYAQVKHQKRINAELKGFQFVSDGDPLGSGAPISDDDFDDLELDDDGDDLV